MPYGSEQERFGKWRSKKWRKEKCGWVAEGIKNRKNSDGTEKEDKIRGKKWKEKMGLILENNWLRKPQNVFRNTIHDGMA